MEREVASEAVPTVRQRYSKQWASITQGLDVHMRVLEQQPIKGHQLHVARLMVGSILELNLVCEVHNLGRGHCHHVR
ncbi:hypothetical protein M0804_000747 [Polistes exclamans]|nr:hypothetical protein M0804_000747 [Polistes exclamans]